MMTEGSLVWHDDKHDHTERWLVVSALPVRKWLKTEEEVGAD
jgi:hypothetical protein